ncbi:hypothetical protein CK203_055472 [Vitis vinifera]|uniref:Uncharacterized protein n=1 Tax=Vitis vinifera TaxID=29760 RepID=A0A438GJF0_VITVI|nr:hypothetical protein CK203_055472 [Vitis vinifera]
MASTNDDEEEESESESDEDSMEEEFTNENANMCFMALEEHEDEVEPQLNRSRSGSTPNSIGRGPGQPPAQPVDGCKKPFLSSRMVVQLVKVEPQPVDPYLNRLRSGQGAVEVQRSPAKD